jgi:hypothetical protein
MGGKGGRNSVKICTIVLIVFLINPLLNQLRAQGLSVALTEKVETPRTARIMFYNCENLFDCIDDTLKNDEEFLPDGKRYWTKGKYYDKLNHISQVITAVGGWLPPELVGLCEIENYKTLHDLTHNSPLYRAEYKIIHKESPDNRGIDVALLYQPKSYKPIHSQFIGIQFPNEPKKHTRDILYSKGVLHQTDTLHVFVNHWPSRWGGELESEEYRIFVASVLKKHTDSLCAANNKPNIIIMGDFNDEPTNRSINVVLGAKMKATEFSHNQLYNLTTLSNEPQQTGTLKYQGNWSVIDQFIISGNLLVQDAELYTTSNNITIFNAPFLLERDDAYLGYKPFRTFVGYKYNGGYSDHLPVFFDLKRR